MVALEDLTNFSGNEGEDALLWYKSFINATSPLGERGMLSNFPLYLETGSPAQVWCDELSEVVMSNWTTLDRNFRRTWLRPGGTSVEDTERLIERFQNHRLRDDEIFTLSLDVSVIKRVIVDWAEGHVLFGVATKLDDATLIQTTIPHLPAFLRAFLRYKSKSPTTFQALCARIKEITEPILEFEQLCRQEKNVERLVQETDSDEGNSDSAVATTDSTSLSTPTNWKKTKVSVNKVEMIEIVKEAIGALHKYEPSEIACGAAIMVEVGLLHYYTAIKATNRFHYSRIKGKPLSMSLVGQGLFPIIYHRGFDSIGYSTEATKIWESFSSSTHVIRGDCIFEPSHTHCPYDNGREHSISPFDTPYYGGYIEKGDGSSRPRFYIRTFRTVQYFLLSVYLAECVTTNDK